MCPSSDGSSGGFILFLREGALLAQAFDGIAAYRRPDSRIAENVGNTRQLWMVFRVSHGRVWRFGPACRCAANDLVWFDRQGKRLGQLGTAPGLRGGVQLSPDGKRVVDRPRAADELSAGALGGVQGARVWTAELSRAIFSRLNPGEGTESAPASLTGRPRGVHLDAEWAVGDLYWMPAGGIGPPEPLLVNSPTVKHPNGFSPDGQFLIYDDHTAQRQDLLDPARSRPAGGGERKPIPFLVTQADETFGQFSPDGKWIAYSSDESGRREVYVQGFAPDRVPAAAAASGRCPPPAATSHSGARDGKELYYIAPDRKLMAVPVTPGPPFEPGVAVPLFETRVTGSSPTTSAPMGGFSRRAPRVAAPHRRP